ncbi:MAG: hypothetical protein E6R03_13730 [Hyphomicrobiaceae bacterium]|nr:MAG: hypothetical protein E6R03_13730 [Hyphomicrobiaceae bacterium]
MSLFRFTPDPSKPPKVKPRKERQPRKHPKIHDIPLGVETETRHFTLDDIEQARRLYASANRKPGLTVGFPADTITRLLARIAYDSYTEEPDE